MIVTEKDAEKTFLEELHSAKQQAGFRAIHYNFNALATKYSDQSIAQTLLSTQMIPETLDDPYVKAFLCQDSDLIIISQKIFNKNFNKLNQQIFAEYGIEHLQEYVTLYDINDHWAKLHNIVQGKYDAIIARAKLAQKKIQEAERKEKKSQILSGKNLNGDILKTINSRRSGRAESAVLIVEDDAFSRKLIRNVLKEKYSVTDVEDGESALNAYVATAPNVVFLDIDLPDINGHEILKAILNLDTNAYVVMLSGNTDKSNVMNAMQSGAKGFVAKPFLKDKLYKYIDDCPTVTTQMQ